MSCLTVYATSILGMLTFVDPDRFFIWKGLCKPPGFHLIGNKNEGFKLIFHELRNQSTRSFNNPNGRPIHLE
jgi:hypothetical protein